MKTLNQYSKERSTFISIDAGESYTGIYRGYKFIEKDSFGETKEYARYMLEDLEDGKVRTFDSLSVGLARAMSGVKEGQEVTISRTGEGRNTKYEVEVEGSPKKEDIPVIEEDVIEDVIEDDEDIDDINARLASGS